ncbi:hypothetical protein [Nocardiopsis ganjiahuensis]|uniref:hypothetical protein n=1 Tax=Nocardiopsis ganjiahuensis TaxID=239984 RepID=UPI0003461272|nr:hypothetical protein [Nocardiopsis ganjiahuensis]
MARERRTENVLVWVGTGMVAGALFLAVVAAVLHWSDRGWGLFEAAGWGWFWSCAIGVIFLMLGVRWGRAHAAQPPDAESGWEYVLYLVPMIVLVSLAAGGGALLGADAEGPGSLAPSELRMGVVVCSVALGLVLMLTAVRPPRLFPRTRSLPFFGAGALAVVLVGAGAPALAGDPGDADRSEVRHVVAENPPEKAPVPERVREVGWVWEPGGAATIHWIGSGVHGPLVAFADGVVSLDGTDGSEVWSYRRPAAEEVSVWAGNGWVLVTHTPEGDPDSEDGPDDAEEDAEEPVTEVFDLATGESAGEYTGPPEQEPDGDTGQLLGWSDGIGVHTDSREGVDEFLGSAGVSAWDGESGEELWYRRLAPEEGDVCEGSPPRVHTETIVYAVACVSGDEFAESHGDLWGLIRQGDAHTEFRVVSLDLRTGQERWSYERDDWAGAYVPERPWRGRGGEGSADALVVPSRWSGQFGLLLDPDTGEEIMHLTEDLLGTEDGFTAEEVLAADGDGVTVRFHRSGQGAEVHHVTPSGARTELVGAGGAYLSTTVDSGAAALGGQMLFPDPESEYEDRAQVLVAPHGGRLGRGPDNRIEMESGGGVSQLVRVSGGVAALLLNETGRAHRVEGLVP